MPRWPEDSRDRLITAAVDLFAEHGYAATTVDQIARRAGVTSRTFFRHFPDKEEVLFADDDVVLPVLCDLITASTEPVRADVLMADVLGKLGDVLEPDRDDLRRRQSIIDEDVALAGRELAKQGRWQAAIAEAIATRGFGADEADLLAALGFALFRRTMHGWLVDDAPDSLRDRLAVALPRVRTVLDVVSTTPPPG